MLHMGWAKKRLPKTTSTILTSRDPITTQITEDPSLHMTFPDTKDGEIQSIHFYNFAEPEMRNKNDALEEKGKVIDYKKLKGDKQEIAVIEYKNEPPEMLTSGYSLSTLFHQKVLMKMCAGEGLDKEAQRVASPDDSSAPAEAQK
jgi:hypothetical protein